MRRIEERWLIDAADAVSTERKLTNNIFSLIQFLIGPAGTTFCPYATMLDMKHPCCQWIVVAACKLSRMSRGTFSSEQTTAIIRTNWWSELSRKREFKGGMKYLFQGFLVIWVQDPQIRCTNKWHLELIHNLRTTLRYNVPCTAEERPTLPRRSFPLRFTVELDEKRTNTFVLRKHHLWESI